MAARADSAGAEYALAGGARGTPLQAPDHFIELSADFLPSDALEFPADVRITPATPDGGPSLVRVCLPTAEGRFLLDDLLRLGYLVRKAAPNDVRDADVEDYYVRCPEPDLVRLQALGGITLSRGVAGTFALAAAHTIRVEAGAQWRADLEAGEDIWLEAGSLVTGSVRTPGILTMEEGARVDGNLHVGRVRFLSADHATVRPTGRRPPRAWPQPPGREVLAPPLPVAPPVESAPATPVMVPVTPAVVPAPPPVLPTPVQAPEAGHFDWGSTFPGRYRIVARAKPAESEIPKPFRAHLTGPGRLEVEVLEVTETQIVVLLHPGTEVQRRLVCSPDEVRQDPVLWALLPILGRVTTLRMLYGDGTLGVRASADSIRWLITLFGKILSLESRLGRLEQMRIFTEPEADPKESAFLMEPEATTAAATESARSQETKP